MSVSRAWHFEPVDTWFFRDGSPLQRGEALLTRPRSAFPPPVSVLQGAVRAILATAAGWSPAHQGRWPEELGGPDDVGVLRFRGPYVTLKSAPLFPLPGVFLASADGEDMSPSVTRLLPGEGLVRTDMGSVRLLEARTPDRGGKRLRGLVAGNAMEDVLAGHPPDLSSVVDWAQVWKAEPRVTIARDLASGTVLERHLTMTDHVRLGPGFGVSVHVAGARAEWTPGGGVLVPFGGEGRGAWVTVGDGEPAPLPRYPGVEPDADGKARFFVALITPGRFADPGRVVRDGPEEVPGRCVSASLERMRAVGGYDLRRGRSRPTVPEVPAGTVWFYEGDKDMDGALSRLHGACLGGGEELGYGQCLIGRWRRDG